MMVNPQPPQEAPSISGFFQKLGASIQMGVKAFTMRFASASRTWYWGSGTGGQGTSRRNYAAFVGEGRGNSIVMSCTLWLCRTFPEAPIQVLRGKGSGRKRVMEPVDRHPMTVLLKKPNPYYSGVLLWMATLADWLLSGNAYWIKQRQVGGKVMALYWVPQRLMEPKWDNEENGVSTQFITHYEYKIDGGPFRVAPEDVVHFRYGIDPDNIRRGLSPIGSLLREIFTDDEAANYSAAILSNLGVPGLMITPDTESAELDQEEADRIKTEAANRFTADNRGSTMVFSARMKAQILSFSPQQMSVDLLRRLPEERVSAIIGTPAIVVGLGAGLDRSTFANFAEAREAAYESNVIPTQRLIAAELETQLLPDFPGSDNLEVGFDLSEVRVLQEDQNAKHERVREDWKAGLISLAQAQEQIGVDPDPNGVDLYFVPSTGTLTPAERLEPPEVDPLTGLPPGQTAPALPDGGGAAGGDPDASQAPKPAASTSGTNGAATRGWTVATNGAVTTNGVAH